MKYAQVFKQQDQGRRQLWFIAGPDKAMVQDALELAKDHARSGVATTAMSVCVGSDTNGRSLRERLLEQVPEDRSIVILLDADEFDGWNQVVDILGTLPKKTFFIAVSNADKVDKGQQYIRSFMGSPKTRLVECGRLDDKEKLAWINSRIVIDNDAAKFLIRYANGDSEWLLNTVRMLQTWTGVVTIDVVERLFKRPGTPNVAESLLKSRKRDAILSVSKGGIDPNALPLIYTTVRKLSLIYEAIGTTGKFTWHLTERTKLPNSEVLKLRPSAKRYDFISVYRALSTMHELYPYLRAGERWAWYILIFRW